LHNITAPMHEPTKLAMKYLIDRLICPDCHSQIYIDDKESLSCKKCHRIFQEKDSILNLLPSEKGEHGEIEERDILGGFVAYLVDKGGVHAYTFTGLWFDIGSIDVYKSLQQTLETKRL